MIPSSSSENGEGGKYKSIYIEAGCGEMVIVLHPERTAAKAKKGACL